MAAIVHALLNVVWELYMHMANPDPADPRPIVRCLPDYHTWRGIGECFTMWAPR